jgi:hypothetical protein
MLANYNSRINLKLNISDTSSMLLPYFRDADTTSLNLTSRFSTKLNVSDTASMLANYNSRINLKLNISDTSSMLLPYFRDADTTSLNLTSRFAAKLNISDTASMLTNYLRSGVAASTYLTQSNAASTYLPLTGGTLTGNLSVNGTSTLNFTNVYGKNTYVPFNVGTGEQSIFNVGAYLRGGTVMIFPDSSLAGSSANLFFANSSGVGDEFSARGSGIRNYTFQTGDKNRNSLALYTSNIGQQNTNRLYINFNGDIGINDDTPSFKLDVNGTLGVTGATTLSGAFTVNNATVFNEGSGDFDTRIESDGNANMIFVDASTDRVGIGTGTPSKTLDVNGEVKIATVTATPTSLLGKDGSNVVGEVTDINQSGVMKVGGITQNTSSVGIINVAHGLSYTPTKVIATIAQQNSYVIVCHGITSTNLNFTIYDSTDGTALNNVSVGFFWIAFK